MPDAADPWSFDYFSPQTPHVPAPSPKARAPKLLPEIERLFQVQRNSLKVLQDIQHIGHGMKDPKAKASLLALVRDAENTYRVIRTYLAKYADTDGGVLE